MPTAKELWDKYVKTQDDNELVNNGYTSWYFCDNKDCANELLELVIKGEKKATASALWTLENEGEPIPNVGDMSVITNWEGEAKCIVQTNGIEIVAFNEVTKEFANLEGEGDKTLKYWRDVHWEYFNRELAKYNLTASSNMPIICETFNVVFK